MPTVTIMFEGICCHIQPPSGSPKRRAILPPVHHHIPYLEVYTTDIDAAANPDFTFVPAYTRFNVSYRHTRLDNVKVELLNITSPPANYKELPSFAQRIPKLTAVEPRFTTVRPALLLPSIPSGQVAAYFDITAGILSSGPSEGFRTVFEPEHAWPVRHLGQWVQLDVEVSDNAPMLRVTPLAGGASRTLTLKEGTDTITIGNQTELDIHGLPSAVGHFEHYYDLAHPRPADPVPKPREGLGLGIGCVDTQWP